MLGKSVLSVAVALCLIAFSPSAYADCGECGEHGEYKEHKEHKLGSLWNRIKGGDDDRDHHGHGKEHGKREKCGHGKSHGKSHGKWHGKSAKPGVYAFWWRSSSMAELLRLDEGQVARLDAVSASYRDTMRKASDKMFEAKWEFRKLMKNPESSAEEIKAAAEVMYRARTEKKRLKLEKKLAMREVLRPEQRNDLYVLKRKGHKKGCGFGKGH